MGLIKNVRSNGNNTLANPGTWLVDALGGGSSSRSGRKVTQDTALQLAAVYACVRILSETIAHLPLHVYERLERGKKKAPDHHLYELLHDQPNDLMTSFTYRETTMAHILLTGNSYSEIERDKGGRPVALWPLTPDRVTPRRINSLKLVYDVTLPGGGQATLNGEDVFHIPGLGYDGLRGYNPLHMHREAIGMGLAAEEYGARFFGNGAKPGGVIEHPNGMSDGSHKRLRDDWERMHKGLDRSHRVAILEEGAKYAQTGIAPNEAQFLETRKFQKQEIAMIFRVPPHLLADLDRATFSNIEQQGIDFATYSIVPWLERWEQAMRMQLFGKDERKIYFAEYNVDGLLRGDVQTRTAAYVSQFQNGFISRNEVRAEENRNPIEGGDTFYVPLNLVPADEDRSRQFIEPSEPTDPVDPPDLESEEDELRSKKKHRVINGYRSKRALSGRQARAAELRSRTAKSYKTLMKRTMQRVYRREQADVMRQAKKIFSNESERTKRDNQQFVGWLSDFYLGHRGFVESNVQPIVDTLAEQVYASVRDEVGGMDNVPDSIKRFTLHYVQSFARRQSGRSFNLIRKLLEQKSDFLVALQAMFEEWDEERAESVAEDESVRGTGAITQQAYMALSVAMMRWVAEPGSCAYCSELDGVVVGVEQSFVRDGDAIDIDGEDTFSPSTSISHPPLHGGCNCQIVAET